MRIHLDLLQGTLDMLILQTLLHGRQHGYGIAGFIAEASHGTFRVLDGALYASLHRLERAKLISAAAGVSDSGRRAKYYELTTEGRVAACEEARKWHQYAAGVARVMMERNTSHDDELTEVDAQPGLKAAGTSTQ